MMRCPCLCAVETVIELLFDSFQMSRMQPRGGNRQNSETVEKTSVVVVAPSKFSNSIDFRRVMIR